MKNTIAAFLIMTLCFSFIGIKDARAGEVCESDNITVTIDGSNLYCDQPPVLVSDHTMVPLRVIFEALGARVEWFEEEQRVWATKDDITVSFQINNDNFIFGEKVLPLDVPPMIINDRTFVPLRVVAESFNCEVNWDEGTRTVSILTSDSDASSSGLSSLVVPISICSTCGGTGRITCFICGGTGMKQQTTYVQQPNLMTVPGQYSPPIMVPKTVMIPCGSCNGGKGKQICTVCHGKGWN